MPIITLTTDLGLKDYYTASVKAVILANCPEAVIIDISHQVSKFDILQAAFILGNSYRDFPEGTIHISGVLPDKTREVTHVAIFCDKHYFIGADNGIFPVILKKKPELIIELTSTGEKRILTFPVKDIFAKAAAHLANGGKIEELGKPKIHLYKKTEFYPVVNENTIRGTVIYIDDFGNIIVNITEQMFEQSLNDRKFSISFRAGGYTIKKISKNYNEVPPGEMLALFSTSGMLEIAINGGNASDLLGIRTNDIVLVDFTQ